MDPGTAQERASSAELPGSEPDAIDFVRFCYRRRHVGWPELYDEMCAVAGRGLYHGYCAEDLSRLGIGFALYEMPALATIVQRVVAEDQVKRRLSAQAIRVQYIEAEDPVDPETDETESALNGASATPDPGSTDIHPAGQPESHPRLVAMSAGAR